MHMAHAMKRHIAGGGAAMVAMIAFGLVQPMPQVARADYTEADARRAMRRIERSSKTRLKQSFCESKVCGRF